MIPNIRDQFKDSVSKHRDGIAIRYKKNDIGWIGIGYGDLYKNIVALSNFLGDIHIGKDDKIAILMHNRPEWPVVFLSIALAGAVSVPLNPESDRLEIENNLNDAGCKLLFVEGGQSDFLNNIRTHCPTIEKVVSVDSDEFSKIQNTDEIQDHNNITIIDSDVACILYTSGTTDTPKGVMLTHGNLISNCDALFRLGLLAEGGSIVSILPLYHAFPLTITMLVPLIFGRTIIYPGTMKGEELLACMRETNPDIFVAVPQIYYLFLERISDELNHIPFPFRVVLNSVLGYLYKLRQRTNINAAKFLLKKLHGRFGTSLRLFASGGAKLDEEAEKKLSMLGFTILNGYGLTETSPVLTMNTLEKSRPGSVGMPIPDVEIKIVNKNKDGIGEVTARGPNIMKGYYRRDDLTRQVIKDGWFYTGDLGYIDKDGYLFLTGRSKEIIVLSSGVNLYPDEIEDAYMKHAPIKEMCVFDIPAVKGPEGREVLWAVIRPDLEFFRKYGEVNLRNVIRERLDNASRTLVVYKRIMGFHVTLEPLSRTSLGKLKRFAIREIFLPEIIKEEKHTRPKVVVSPEDNLLVQTDYGKKIIRYLARLRKGGDAILPGDSLELDLGIDSLGRIELISGLEKVLGIKIADEVIGNAFTVRDLIRGIGAILEKGTENLAVDSGESASGSGEEYWGRLFQIPPREKNLNKIDLNPGFWTFLATIPFVGIVRVFFRIFSSLRVEGSDTIIKDGPLIFYVNHVSYFDGLLIGAALPWPLLRDTFFIGFTLDGEIAMFKKGFGILAKESGARLVPVFLEGAYEAWPRTSAFPKRHPIKVKFGEAVRVEELEQKGFKMGAVDAYEAVCLSAREILKGMGSEK